MSRFRKLFSSPFSSHPSSPLKIYISFSCCSFYKDSKIFSGGSSKQAIRWWKNQLEYELWVLFTRYMFFLSSLQEIVQTLKTFLNVALRLRCKLQNIAAGWCEPVGHGDGLACHQPEAKRRLMMALSWFKGKEEYGYFLYSRVYGAGFIVARRIL